MNPNQFRQQVRDALGHLYDQAYLETHALTAVIKPQQPGQARGAALQQQLLDAIQALRPTLDLPYSSVAWRKYRYLYLRYAQAVSLDEISSDLGISLRQARRYSFDALLALTTLLWDRYGEPAAPAAATPAFQSLLADDGDLSDDPDARAAPHQTVDLEMGRVEAEAQEAPVALGELLIGVVDTVRPLALRRGVPLQVTISEGMPIAVVDRAVLRQVLLNVLSLALEVGARSLELGGEPAIASDAAQIQVRVTLGSEVATAVEQINADDRWYIATRLLQAQHGQAELDAADGDLLTIRLTVRSVPRTSVLVVEDNQDVVKLYRRYLSDSAYQILAAPDGSGALKLARTAQPAVILLDVMMPAQDGWEVLQLLQSQVETRATPVIVCTVLKERELALALGAADLLVKPVSRPALLQALAPYAHH